MLLDPNLTTEKLIDLAKDYEKQIKNRKLDGWSFVNYIVSKSLVNAYSRFALRKSLKEKQMIMAMSPGWCRTDMGGPDAKYSVIEGAKKIYYFMFELHDEKYILKFIADYKIIEEN